MFDNFHAENGICYCESSPLPPLSLSLSYIHSLHISSFRTLFLMRYIVSQAEVVEEQMKSTCMHPLLNLE